MESDRTAERVYTTLNALSGAGAVGFKLSGPQESDMALGSFPIRLNPSTATQMQ